MPAQEERTYKVGAKQLLRESELRITVSYKGEVFVLRYPEPVVRNLIEVEIARRLGGFPRSSFTLDHVATVEAYVTVDALYVKDQCPGWFEGPWNCLDEELVLELYRGYWTFRAGFNKKLRGETDQAAGQGVST